jgi:hypothetical protein
VSAENPLQVSAYFFEPVGYGQRPRKTPPKQGFEDYPVNVGKPNICPAVGFSLDY